MDRREFVRPSVCLLCHGEWGGREGGRERERESIFSSSSSHERAMMGDDRRRFYRCRRLFCFPLLSLD